MRIESYFKDYYDSMMMHGMDQSVVYKRHRTTTLNISHTNPLIGLMDRNFKLSSKNFYCAKNRYSCGYLRLNPFIVGFCGQLIQGLQFMQIDYDGVGETKKVFSLKDAQEYSEEYLQEYQVSDYLAKLENSDFGVIENLASHLFKENQEELLLNLFVKLGTPIFTYDLELYEFDTSLGRESHIVINPNLGDIGFDKFKNAKSCYQEIFQFLASGFEKRVPQETPMSSMEKVNQHGFDPKYGFRKRPGSKKRKRRKK